MSTEKPTVNKTDEAKKIIEKEEKERMEQAGKEIQAVMEKYKCELSASVIVTHKGNIPQITIIPKPL